MKFQLETIIPVIAAIITALFGSGALTNYFLSNESSYVTVGLTPDYNNLSKSLLEIDNFGNRFATNMTIFFESPILIKEIIKTFSTSDIFLNNTKLEPIKKSINVNDKSVRLYIPKLWPGDGSIIRMNIVFEEEQITEENPIIRWIQSWFKPKPITNENINIRGIYDQGSFKGRLLPNAQLFDLQYNYYKQPTSFIMFILFLIAYPVAFIIFYYFNQNRRKSSISRSILNIRKSLKKNFFENNNNYIFEQTDLDNLDKKTSSEKNELLIMLYNDLKYNLSLLTTNTIDINKKKNIAFKTIKLIEQILKINSKTISFQRPK